jgi:hypothetical protein
MTGSSSSPNRRRARLLGAVETLRLHTQDRQLALRAWLRRLQIPGGLHALVELHPAVFAVTTQVLPTCSRPMPVDEMDIVDTTDVL